MRHGLFDRAQEYGAARARDVGVVTEADVDRLIQQHRREQRSAGKRAATRV